MADGGHASGSGAGGAPRPDADVGLCSICRHASTQKGAHGSRFWRCRAAEQDPRLLRYPPLPVTRCPAHQRAD